MIAAAGSLQKLFHLANAREAFASGDFPQALSEVDAAVAADATFAAAQSLRQEIVARMNAVPPSVPKAPLVRDMTIPPPSQPHRRTRSLWPARVRTGLAICTLFGVGLIAVMLVRSGKRGADVPTAAALKTPPVVPIATVKTPPAVPVALDVELPRPVTTAPAPLPKVAPASAKDVETTEWASARLTRLNVRPRWRASAMHVDDAALIRDLGEGISELWVGKLTGNEDAIFVGGNLDESDWVKLRASIKPTGIVWRIYPHRSGSVSDGFGPAVAAGFMRGRQVRYSSDYVAEQFTPRARPLLRPTRGGRTTQE
jgi:hypothetical protein